MRDVIAGIVWAVEQAATKAAAAASEYAATGRTGYKGSVISMSIGGSKSRTLEDVVNRAVDSGVHIAVGSGGYYRGDTTCRQDADEFGQAMTVVMLAPTHLLALKSL